MSGRWADAAFEQDRLLGIIRHNNNFRDYLRSFQEQAYPEVEEPDMMLQLHEYKLQEADPMYVSAQVTELWDHARDPNLKTAFKPEPLHPWDLPANIVFALLPRPMLIRDVEDNLISFRAISWIPAGSGEVEWTQDSHPDGVWYTLWSDIDDNDDFERAQNNGNREAWESLGKWSILFSGFVPFGPPERYTLGKLFDDIGDLTKVPEKVGKDMVVRRSVWILLQSFWRLSRQLIPTKEPLPRQLRRQRRRAYRPEEVTVITLRRQRLGHDDGEAMETDWKYQWVVRGHWRNQWYASLGPAKNDDGSLNAQSHRQVWINPYMKGPEDRPIKPVKRAFEFTR